MRWESPAVLATAGTLAIHLLLAVIGDALVVAFPMEKPDPAPVVELVDIEPLPEPEPPPPPPEPEPEPQVAPEQPAPEPVREQPRPQRVQPRSTQPPPTDPPPPSDTPPSPDSGGDPPVATMDNIAPDAIGNVPVGKGRRGTGRPGRGGSGGGTGSGAGTGSSDAPPPPVSVATIKTRAMPKGDHSYFDASKDYPPEAKSLGIEGVIRVRLIVDAEGIVKSAVLLNRLGHGLDELAMERAKKIRFEPAKDTDDKPVTSVVVWTFNMTLPK